MQNIGILRRIKLVFFLAGVPNLTGACGANLFSPLVKLDPAVEAAIELDNENPNKAIKILLNITVCI